MTFRYSILAAICLLAACKSTPTTENPEAKAERIAVKCDTNPPTRVDYREDGKTIESQGPIDLGGKNCDELAKDTTARAMALKNGKWTNYHPQGDKIQSTGSFSAGKR